MSELKDDAVEYAQDIGHDEYPDIMANSKPDFIHWSKMSFWTLDESTALLLGRDPAIVKWDVVKDYVNYYTSVAASQFCLNYSKLRTLILRAKEMQEIDDPNSPDTFLAWVHSKSLEVPDVLRQAVANINYNINGPAIETNEITSEITKESWELDNQLTLKEKEIEALKEKLRFFENRVAELECLSWEGFDEIKSTYSSELAIAVQAHSAVSKTFKKGISVKKQLYLWLEKNGSTLSNEARDRIATVCNWQKGGGAPSTPS